MPLLAAAAAGLVVASLWGANTVSLYAARRELARAASFAALAGAASTPLVGALTAGEPEVTACTQAAALLTRASADGTSTVAPFATALSTTGVARCGAGVTVDPVVDWTTVETVRAAVERLMGDLGIARPDLCDPLVAPAVDPVLGTLTDTDCASVRDAIAGLPLNLSPASVTPRVRVTILDDVRPPVPLPEFGGVRTLALSSTARRRFKNVVVLPAVRRDLVTGLPEPVQDLVDGAPAPLESIDPNAEAAAVREALLPKLWEANAMLGTHLNPLLPSGVTFDLSQLLLDAQDLYDPPGGAPSPSVLDVAAEAARTGDPVVVLRLFRMPVLGIPAFDFTAAYLSPLADGTFEATPIPVEQLSSAAGLFGATLVRDDA